MISHTSTSKLANANATSQECHARPTNHTLMRQPVVVSAPRAKFKQILLFQPSANQHALTNANITKRVAHFTHQTSTQKTAHANATRRQIHALHPSLLLMSQLVHANAMSLRPLAQARTSCLTQLPVPVFAFRKKECAVIQPFLTS